jgi:hypothetical protein
MSTTLALILVGQDKGHLTTTERMSLDRTIAMAVPNDRGAVKRWADALDPFLAATGNRRSAIFSALDGSTFGSSYTAKTEGNWFTIMPNVRDENRGTFLKAQIGNDNKLSQFEIGLMLDMLPPDTNGTPLTQQEVLNKANDLFDAAGFPRAMSSDMATLNNDWIITTWVKDDVTGVKTTYITQFDPKNAGVRKFWVKM